MKKILIIIFIFIFMLCGCYNYKELNKIAIVSSIGIDKKEDVYLVSAQVMNIKDNENTDSSKVIVYEEKGKTIEEALRKMTTKSNKKLYGGHLGKIVISDIVAKESIIDVLDLFQRLPEIKDEFSIVIAKDIKASDVIKIMTSPENIPADYVTSAIETSFMESALTYSSNLDEFISYYLKDYIDPVIAVLEVKNYREKGTTIKNNETTDPDTKIVLDNIAITHDGKLEAFLNEDETIGYNFISNNVSEMIIPIKCDNDDNYSSISVTSSKTKNSIKKDNDKYIINLEINTSASINEYNCKKDLTKEETIKFLENKTSKKIKDYINNTISLKDKYKSEFLGFKRMIYLEYPNYNNEEFDIKIKTNVNISRSGDIRNSSKGEKYEH